MSHFSKSRINWAGQVIISEDPADRDLIDAYLEINHWRAAHAYPINTFQATLRNKLKKIDPTALVAQRLKRITSIEAKLLRFPAMRLSRMQDIGGLRAVVSDIPKLIALRKSYMLSRFSHELVGTKDYIENPKDSGYRGIHLIYKYNNPVEEEFNGLSIEIQLRTRVQHAWATAVETSGLFVNSSLKSSEGPSDWLEFFALASSTFAMLEGARPTRRHRDFINEYIPRKMLAEANRLKVREKINAYATVAKAILGPRKGKYYYLVVLDLERREIRLSAYRKSQLQRASSEYLSCEQEVRNGRDLQVVLVAADSVSALRKAYPSYFLDTHTFISMLDRVERRLYRKWNPKQLALPLRLG